MVATLDPWYMANSFLGRKALPACDVLVTMCSAREIESLVGLGQRVPVGPMLREVMGDAERSLWSLGLALQPHHLEGDRNPLLDQAWKEYPFN
jgi:hypothetical protein